MFDFGFSELVVICIVALVVLGPTRLPGLVRKVGRWVGKARAMARDFREQLENEVNLEELSRATRQPPSPASATPPVPPAPAPSAPAPSSPVSSAEEPAPPSASVAGSYPYGTPTDIDTPPTSTSARSADPAVVQDGPQPGDDDYSHAHAHGAAPEPWIPEPDVPSESPAPASEPAQTGKPAV